MKTITICDKEYEIDCNAFSYIYYKKIFNKSIFEDMRIIGSFFINQKETSINVYDYIEVLTRITYLCIYTANQDIEIYDEWMKNIKRINADDMWSIQIIEIIADCFVDSELIEELDKKCSGDKSKDIFPEHSFIASCLRIGLTINDLKLLTYVDVMKILVSFLPDKEETKEESVKVATQQDIDRFLR